MSVVDLGHPGLTYPEPSLRRYVMMGIAVVVIGFGGFLLWGFLSSLDRAAIADGTVVVDSNKKSVQHLEGGIVARINVREGDIVEARQVLLEVDPTAALAERDQLASREASLRLQAERLRAFADGRAAIPRTRAGRHRTGECAAEAGQRGRRRRQGRRRRIRPEPARWRSPRR